MEGIEKRYKTKLKAIQALPVSEEKLVRMMLDVQNTAILSIRSCSKYCFSPDGVQEIEKEIQDLKTKFARYFEGFMQRNEKKSRTIAAQELATLYGKIEQKAEEGDNAYDVHHLTEFESDLNALIRSFSGLRQSKVGPHKADAFLDLLEEKIPEIW